MILIIKIHILISLLNFNIDSKECCDFTFTKEFSTTDSHLHTDGISEVIADHNENIYVSDSWLRKILVFDEDGEFVREIGQIGRGPGDFENVNSIRINEGRLYALDSNLQRVTSFDLDSGNVIDTYSLPGLDNLRGTTGVFLSDDVVLLNYALPFQTGELHNERKGSFGLVNFRKSETVEKLFSRIYHEALVITFQGGGFAAASRPYGKFYTVRPASDGSFYWGYPDSFNIEKWNGSTLVQTYSGEKEPVKVTTGDIENYYFPQLGVESLDELRQRIRSRNVSDDFVRIAERYVWVTTEPGQMTEYFPVYDWFAVCDRNYLWIAFNTEDRDYYEIKRLDPDGNEAGRGKLSKGVRFFTINGTSAYGTEEDPETGEKNIVRYSITFN